MKKKKKKGKKKGTMKLRYNANQILQFSSTLLFSTNTHTDTICIYWQKHRTEQKTKRKEEVMKQKRQLLPFLSGVRARATFTLYVYSSIMWRRFQLTKTKKKFQLFFFLHKKLSNTLKKWLEITWNLRWWLDERIFH